MVERKDDMRSKTLEFKTEISNVYENRKRLYQTMAQVRFGLERMITKSNRG